ncbi:MAG: hypothetical protein AB7S38_32530 [Vulcanimicrobiota bacterium]
MRFLYALFALCALLLLADPLVERHPHFAWESWPGFYAVYSFVAYALLVLISKHCLRPLVEREEDYYE